MKAYVDSLIVAHGGFNLTKKSPVCNGVLTILQRGLTPPHPLIKLNVIVLHVSLLKET